MPKYIDADALEVVGFTDRQGSFSDGVQWLLEYIDKLPPADVQPVRHGRWIIKDNPGTGWYRITCSECGEDVTSTVLVIGFFPNAKVIWDYCPECGARMDGE